MLLLLCFLSLALGAASSSTDHEVRLERGSCPMFWYSFNGRCYKYVATRMTWADAELHCVSEGANLVSLHSLDEHNFVIHLIKNFDPEQGSTWIGLSDLHKEGRWMWSDGSKVNFTFWHSGQPDNIQGTEHCGEIHIGTIRWNDNICSTPHSFVCASRTVCPNNCNSLG
ncbi:galactose-specific lectin nattectin-like [Myripristis murdjan]|nr:galactose-specific lectin nattectin-like [Myripristis murdjan]